MSFLRLARDIPSRNGCLRSISSVDSRQRRSFPSAVRRSRLQLKQKCSLIGVIKPMVPLALGKQKYLAGPLPTLGKQGFSLPNCSRFFFMSATEINCEVITPWLVTGMNSMKRTCQSSSMVFLAKSRSSCKIWGGKLQLKV